MLLILFSDGDDSLCRRWGNVRARGIWPRVGNVRGPGNEWQMSRNMKSWGPCKLMEISDPKLANFYKKKVCQLMGQALANSVEFIWRLETIEKWRVNIVLGANLRYTSIFLAVLIKGALCIVGKYATCGSPEGPLILERPFNFEQCPMLLTVFINFGRNFLSIVYKSQ